MIAVVRPENIIRGSVTVIEMQNKGAKRVCQAVASRNPVGKDSFEDAHQDMKQARGQASQVPL